MKTGPWLICAASAIPLVATPGLTQATAPISQAVDQTAPTGVEDIVVTAQKRSERLQDVPIAITALSATALERSGIRSTTDLNVATPSLNITNFSGSLLISLRGVGTTNAQVGNENSVALYIDGSYVPSLRGSVFSLNSVERIEVLKGPQGTLFGRNATGGAVQIITRNPSYSPSVEFAAGYESYDTVNLRGYATTGLTDTLAIDIAGYYHNQDKTLGVNVGTGNPVGRGREYDFLSKMRWEPDPDTSVTLTGTYANVRDSVGYIYSRYPNSPYGPGAGFLGTTKPYDAGADFDPIGHSISKMGSLNVSHDFEAFRFVSISTLSDFKGSYQLDQDQTPTPLVYATLPGHEKSGSQEVQFLSPTSSKLQLIAGAFYFRDVARYAPHIMGLAFPAGQVRSTKQTLESKALFGQATYPIFENTDLTLGARYTWDDISFLGVCTNATGTVLALKSCNALFPISGQTIQQTSSSSSQPSWRASLSHKFTPDVMVYASYNKGYKSGGYNLTSVPTDPASVAQPKVPKPETLAAYEVGLKATVLDRRLRFNPSFFYYDYRSLQVLVNQGGLTFQDNAPKARIYGVDMDGEFVPVDALHILFGASVMKNEFVEWPNAVCYTHRTVAPYGSIASTCDVKGKHLPRVPTFTGNLGFTYDIPVGVGKVTVGANAYHNGGFYWHPDNRIRQSAYTLLNADLAWLPNEVFRVRLYGRNLTNRHYAVNAQESTFGDYRNSASPRQIGIEAGVKF